MDHAQAGMHERAPPSESAGALSDYPPALVEATLARVIASRTFRRSQRHRAFLAHVIDAGLVGDRDRLKEVIIGIEVFGRSLPDYDPRRDPIVRVEAGRIRDKLARFYEGEGAGESFQIVLPVGNYLPRFMRRRFDAQSGRSPHDHALAVLPFTNLSSDPDDEALALGLADQLIDAIGRLPGLKVVARLSALKARDAGTTMKGIGKLLGVDHIVEGSLQRSGARLRCIAQLSRTQDGMRVWSQHFEYDTEREDDIFDFQDAIADAVLAAVTTLRVAPTSTGDAPFRPVTALLPTGTANRDARDLFERARYLTQQRSLDGYEKAIVLLERAVALDPGFAQAYSHLAAAYANRTGLNLEPTYPSFDHVERAARRALELDPLDGDARAMLAVIAYRLEFRWHDARPMFQEALRLSPNSPLVHSTYAWALVFNGRPDEAMRHVRLSQDLDPLNLGLRASNAAIAMHARRYAHAIAEFDAVLQLEPEHFFARIVAGMTHLCAGRLDEAGVYFAHVARIAPTHFTPRFCSICVLGLQGERDAGLRALSALLEDIGERHFSRVNLAMTQTCLGDIDGSFTSLAYAAETRDTLFVSLPTHPLFEPLRRDPRYPALLARYGLTAVPEADAQSPT